MNTDRLHTDLGDDAKTIAPGRMRRRTGRHSGASLVEVLVVLVVILIGIFGIIQIFPIGFTSLKKSEARLRADRLARNTTESLNVDSSTLPESITFSYYDTGVRRTVTSEDPDNLGTYPGPSSNKLYFSDVNKFRYITNEPVRVPLASATAADSGFGNGVGSVHFLAFGPIYMNATVGDPTTAPNYADSTSKSLYDSYLKITSEKLSGVVVDSTNGTNTRGLPPVFSGYLRGANSYVIDYGDDDTPPAILFAAASKDRVFSVTYSYEEEPADPNIPSTIVTVTVDVPVAAGNAGFVWNQLGTKAILANSESVVRDFVRLPIGAQWDATDPYQYKLASANVSPSANLGVVAFNPAGANFSVSVPGGTKPFTALASYAVLDWHILRDDREVPEGVVSEPGDVGVARVRTSLPSIRVRGEDFVDLTETGANRNQIYPGLYPQTAVYNESTPIPPVSVSPDIQVFNLSDNSGTARLLVAGDLANKGTASAPGADFNADYWINRAGRGGTYPTGTIYINTDRVPAGSKVRILYKAQGNWAVSFQKAAKAYRNEEVATGAGPRPVLNKAEVFATDGMGTGANFSDDRVYFHRTELNKGMTAVIEYDTATGTTRLPARQFTVATPNDDYAYIRAAEIAPEITGSGVTGWRIFGPVSGASLKTRVIWQDETNGRTPWRVSDLETYVTRQAQ